MLIRMQAKPLRKKASLSYIISSVYTCHSDTREDDFINMILINGL